MSIPVFAGNETHGHSVIWHEIPQPGAAFLIVKDGALGLSSEGYVSNVIERITSGDTCISDEWDKLLIQTADMELPEPCFVETTTEEGVAVAIFRTEGHDGNVRYRMEF